MTRLSRGLPIRTLARRRRPLFPAVLAWLAAHPGSDSRGVLAVHESTHVCGLLLFRIPFAEVDVTGKHGFPGFVSTPGRTGWEGDPGFLVAVLMAPAAEAVLLGEPVSAALRTSSINDYRMTVDAVGELVADEVLTWAVGLVPHYAARIDAVAAALLETGTMTQAQVLDVLTPIRTFPTVSKVGGTRP